MPAGSRFGPFHLREMLASGGMGELYVAIRLDPPDPSPVALKILLPEYRENEEFLRMFQDEARIGMQLAHPNIVDVRDVGVIEGTPYLVMEYVHGENLRAVNKACRASGAKLPVELAVRLSIDVLLGLSHAHRARDERGEPLKLVHRDLSPDNVMVSYAGKVKILDFGIARAEGRSTRTQLGVLKGKGQYMSPEQASGKPVDPRSDLFSLGLVLLETLTGKKRLQMDDAVGQILEARRWEPPLPSQLEHDAPGGLAGVVVHSIQLDPERRFQSADEMASALFHLLDGGALPRSREDLAGMMRRLFPDRSEVWSPPAASEPPRPRRRPEPSPAPGLEGRPTRAFTNLADTAVELPSFLARPGPARLDPPPSEPTGGVAAGTRVSSPDEILSIRDDEGSRTPITRLPARRAGGWVRSFLLLALFVALGTAAAELLPQRLPPPVRQALETRARDTADRVSKMRLPPALTGRLAILVKGSAGTPAASRKR